MSAVLQQLNSEMGEVVRGVRPSLIRVRTGERGEGAGTVWHPEGLILTNAHVVGRHPIWVTLWDGTELDARFLARDDGLDVAASGLPAIALGESRSLKAGELVLALGHPWGVRGAGTVGVVIGVGSDLLELPRSGREWIAVRLHLRSGYSGGPLIDAQGKLAGMNTMMNGPDAGMAVPVHVAKPFLRQTLGSEKAVA